jgi:hypothetical protein
LRQPCLACVLGQALGIGRHVVDDPMYPNHLGCFRIGRVRIIDNLSRSARLSIDEVPIPCKPLFNCECEQCGARIWVAQSSPIKPSACVPHDDHIRQVKPH